VEGSEFSRQQLLPGVDLTVVPVLEFGRRDVPDAAVQPGLVKPADPVQGGELEVADADAASGSLMARTSGLVEADRRFRQGVIGISYGADRGERRRREADWSS